MINKTKSIEDHTLGTITLRCDCHCTMLVVDKLEWGFKDDSDREINYNFSMQESSFYDPFIIKNRFRNAWNCLFGKRLSYNDIYIENESEVIKFRDALTELISR